MAAPARDQAAVALKLTNQESVVLRDAACDEAVAELAMRLSGSAAQAPHAVGFLNMRSYMAIARDPAARLAFASFDRVYPDGVGLQIARQLSGLPDFRRLAGTDLVPALLRRAPPGTSVFLLGGPPEGVAALERGFRARYPHLRLAGVRHGFYRPVEEPSVVAQIGERRPDLLLVGMGCPRQETFLQRNAEPLQARVAICVGGLFQYWSGELRRAPRLLRRIGLEWAWILAQQPYKWPIYTTGALRFGIRVVRLHRSSFSTPSWQ